MYRLFFLLIVTLGLAGCAGSPSQSGKGEVRIVRDGYGVPHIYADSNFELFYGYGYAVAQDRLFQMEMLKRTTTGRVAEVLGPDYVDLDKQIRTGFDPESIKRQLKALDRQDADIFEGYAAGMNAWLDEVATDPQRHLPAEYVSFDFTPTRWTAYDVVMSFVGSIIHRYADFNEELTNLSLVADLEKQHGRAQARAIFEATLPLIDPDSPTTVPLDSGAEVSGNNSSRHQDHLVLTTPITPPVPLARSASGALRPLPPAARQTYLDAVLSRTGLPGLAGRASASNVWLVSPDRMMDASGVLINGPQFGWTTPSYVYGVGLHGAGFEVVGNTLLAFPFLLFAHNGQIGWGSTAGFGDLVDMFELKLNPENPGEFWRNGRYRKLTTRRELIQVRGAPDVEHLVYTSPYGPLVVRDLDANVAYAKHRTWVGHEVETGVAWVYLAKAQSFDDVRTQLSRMAANINFYYLDAEGQIGYTHSGLYPRRAAGHDNRLPAKGDGSMDWESMLDFSRNPFVHNPESGFITNWNNRPAADWPNSDLWWRRWSRASRVDELNNAIASRPRWSTDALWAVNRQASHADLNLGYLLDTLRTGFAEETPSALIESALISLEQWDRMWMDRDLDGYFDGAGPAIMNTWLTDLNKRVLADDLGEKHFVRYASPGYPIAPIEAAVAVSPGVKAIVANLDRSKSGTAGYDFFNGADPARVMAESFAAAVRDLAQHHGDDLAQWRIAAHPLTFRAYNFRGVPQADPLREQLLPVIMNRGSENNVFVARDGRITGEDVVAPGQSGFANASGTVSDHFADQLPLYQNYQLKPLPLTPGEVGAQTRSETQLRVQR